MKKYNPLMWMIVLVLSTFSVVACSDDEESEWAASYVYLERTDPLQIYKTFHFTHSAAGVIGDDVTTTFVARTQKPVTADVRVKISVTCEGISTEAIRLTKQEVLIKAGEMKSEEITAQVDMAFAESSHDKKEYQFKLLIDEIQTDAPNTLLSTTLKQMVLPIFKSAYVNLALGVPAEAKLMADRSVWTVTMESGLQGAVANLTDGSTSTDVARDGQGFWVMIDFGEAKTIAGIKIQHYGRGISYTATEVELLTSNDGSNWSSMSAVKPNSSIQNILLISPVEARYLKYQMLSIYGSRVSVTELDVYEKNHP